MPEQTKTGSHASRRLKNWLLASLGFVSMGLGVVGIFVPGMPTTVFLLVASFLFTRSCPELNRWMRERPLIQPYLPYLDEARVPASALPAILLFIWSGVALGILVSSAVWVAPVLLVVGAVGTGVVLYRRA